MDLPVLVDEDVWPEFHDAVRAVGDTWPAPSGAEYRLKLDGRRLVVSLVRHDALAPPPAGHVIDGDLFELAAQIQENAGPPWSAEQFRRTVTTWRRLAGEPEP